MHVAVTFLAIALALVTLSTAHPDDHHKDQVKIVLKEGATKAIEKSLRIFLEKAEIAKKALLLKAFDKTIEKIKKWLIEPKKAAIFDKAHHKVEIVKVPVAHEKVEFKVEVPKKVHVPDYFNVHGYGV